jgi:hypothetical protein
MPFLSLLRLTTSICSSVPLLLLLVFSRVRRADKFKLVKQGSSGSDASASGNGSASDNSTVAARPQQQAAAGASMQAPTFQGAFENRDVFFASSFLSA